ncbi:Gfo/Idh/MocA family protein [Natronogracilivirga saccharolytica]|uniref:Gfo/Idh/MocA family oxidoreductase n=1 Tax=Natronogracilivirga saccharolytica TaxID=2812953 RepID=A0A8J7RM89_9BACT|nr:Gfo/Idh/MocA family oxidoreductase [Natronogracilivirga saccharolytica]MBP3193972.1 Gfo/Idh/MocA family oxidoreductase [Natronogracilivirga saccharolytica]
MTHSINRRKFIKMTGAAGVGLGLMGKTSAGMGSVSPNSKVTVAVMGTYSRGSALANGFAQHPNSDVAYICDVDEKAIKKGLDAVKEGGQDREPKGVKDFREALGDNSVDALVIATPIHWHTPASILALQAGKHVYVEKPCSHNIHEGELLVAAANKYGHVVQMGNQRRSWPLVREGIERLKEGIIGDVYFARCWYAQSRGSMGYGKVASVPNHLDYDLWQGPAPRRTYLDNLIHYNWHWRWHWGAGELLNNGVHFLDLARWGLGVDYPIRVSSMGGRYHFNDDQETPDTQVVNYDFAEGKTVSWEARSCNPRGIEGETTGVTFHGTEGTMHLGNNKYIVYDFDDNVVVDSEDDNGDIDFTGPGFDLDEDHITNFTECVQTGEKPVTDIRDANKSVHICHLGNIAYRKQRMLTIAPHNGRIVGDDDAMKLWRREYEPGWEPSI